MAAEFGKPGYACYVRIRVGYGQAVVGSTSGRLEREPIAARSVASCSGAGFPACL